MVSLMKVAFQEGRLPVALIWMTMVLLSKWGGEYRWIGLVEVIYNICASIVNNRLCSTITLYDALNGFRNGRGTGQQP